MIGGVILSQIKRRFFFSFDSLPSFDVMGRFELDDIEIALFLEISSDLVQHLYTASPLIVDFTLVLHLDNSISTKKYLTEWI